MATLTQHFYLGHRYCTLRTEMSMINNGHKTQLCERCFRQKHVLRGAWDKRFKREVRVCARCYTVISGFDNSDSEV